MNHDQSYKTWSLGNYMNKRLSRGNITPYSNNGNLYTPPPPPLQLVSSLWVKKCLLNNLGFYFFIFISTFSLGELKDVIAWF